MTIYLSKTPAQGQEHIRVDKSRICYQQLYHNLGTKKPRSRLGYMLD